MDLSRRTFGALALSLAAPPASTLMVGCTDQAERYASSGSVAQASAGAASRPIGSGTLRAGVRADVMGFRFLNEKTGNHYGSEIDLVRDLAERLGYDDVDYRTVTPDDRKEKLLDGDVDLICACYSIAESYLKNFDFSPACYDDRVIAIVQSSSMIDSVDDLRGGAFGTMAG